jgi:glycosyltransferase involved in cell wall biosynthesis
MKVLHLATHDHFGGAARAAYRQHLALRAVGIDSRMLVRYKHTDDPHVQVFTGHRDWPSRILRTIRRSWISHREKSSRVNGKIGLTDPRADLLRAAVPEVGDADVINFHKTEHFVDVPGLLASLPRITPVVVTLHDLSPITGGCDYPGNCERFMQTCGACPLMDSQQENDYSREIFKARQAAYAARDKKRFAFAANSRWTLENARSSGLTANCPAEVIHYGLDQDVYHPRNRAIAREALGIGANEAVICFAAHNVGYPHKGGVQLAEALNKLKSDSPIRLLTMGSGLMQVPSSFRHTHFGRIENDSLQSLVYRAADVFVIPSLEEAFGQTALEAIACGTVVAGFAVGGIVDTIQKDLNGMLVPRGDSDALGQAISCLLKDNGLRARWQESCVDWIREHFSYAKNAAAYKTLYNSLIVNA